jgi:hypothetical protein
MVINDLHVVGITLPPHETDAPSVVDGLVKTENWAERPKYLAEYRAAYVGIWLPSSRPATPLTGPGYRETPELGSVRGCTPRPM